MSDVTRRRFLAYGLGAGASLAVPWRAGTRAASAAIRGSASAASSPNLGKFLEPVPVPGNGIVVAAPDSPNHYSFVQRTISRQLHPKLPPTPLFAYDDGSGLGGQAGSFGMAVVAQVGTPIQMSFTNNLPITYPSWIPVDTRLTPLGNQVRVMTHLHGGFVAADSDANGVPGGIDPSKFATGPIEPPDPTERGFKDTTKVNPGYFTTIRAQFDLPAGVTAPQTYVHHCHIVEHEDNDMMRPFTVSP
jgi:FtsP/CotA-like multicopper oxidase with cupredoxin domain